MEMSKFEHRMGEKMVTFVSTLKTMSSVPIPGTRASERRSRSHDAGPGGRSSAEPEAKRAKSKSPAR